MQISTARKNAERFLANNMIESRAKRPDPEAKVMVRYPQGSPNVILASDADQLREKLAKRIQSQARRETVH